MSGPHIWIAIGVGGAVGAMARHGVSALSLRLLGPNFPFGTLAVNIVGSLCMGIFIASISAKAPQSETLRAFVIVGLLGGFTTFSAFALDAITLYRDRAPTIAVLYVASSVVLSVAALVAGLTIGKAPS